MTDSLRRLDAVIERLRKGMPCTLCEGMGKRMQTGFRTPKKLIPQTCSACRGSGVLDDFTSFKEQILAVIEAADQSKGEYATSYVEQVYAALESLADAVLGASHDR